MDIADIIRIVLSIILLIEGICIFILGLRVVKTASILSNLADRQLDEINKMHDIIKNVETSTELLKDQVKNTNIRSDVKIKDVKAVEPKAKKAKVKISGPKAFGKVAKSVILSPAVKGKQAVEMCDKWKQDGLTVKSNSVEFSSITALSKYLGCVQSSITYTMNRRNGYTKDGLYKITEKGTK